MATTKTPAVGDPVLFEGLKHKITAIAGDRVQFASELQHTGTVQKPDGSLATKTQPHLTTVGLLADLKWDAGLGAWYMWGRVLSKGRHINCPHCTVDIGGKKQHLGCVRCDDRKVVAALRDEGVLPARKTRQPNAVPAGGEHLNLYKTLFHSGSVNWQQELGNVKRGEGLTTAAKSHAEKYKAEFVKPLADGYASPGANDSTAGEG